MSDFNSSLPIRTEANGDVAVKVVDGTITSQALAIDAAGKVIAKLNDAAGNALTSQANGAQRALDVGINVSGVQIDPRSIRALTSADVVTSNQGSANTIANAWPVKLTDGTNSQSFTASGEAKVDITQPLPAGTNSIGNIGTVSTVTTVTAVTAITNALPAGTNTLGSIKITDGTNTQVVSAGGDAHVIASNLPTVVDTNYGVVGSSTIRTAAQIGNATGAADFNSGATGAQTLRVAANLQVAGAPVTSINPIPVTISSAVPGTAIQNYSTATVAANATSTHDYTVSAAKTFDFARVWASASGKLKVEVQYETAAASGVFNTKFVGFNSTATPNIDITIVSIFPQVTGAKIRVIRTNLDKQSEDVYSTIEGTEV